jgi:hypothetical protein
MNNPTFAHIVSLPTVTLSNGQTVNNRDKDLSVSGWLGIKTGTTSAAGYCLLFAVQRVLPGSTQPVVVFGALLGQLDSPTVLALAPQIADSVFANLGWVDTNTLKPNLGLQLQDAWHTTVPVSIGKPASREVLTPIGTKISLVMIQQVFASENQAKGMKVGELNATLQGNQVRWSLTLGADLPSAPITWRLARN